MNLQELAVLASTTSAVCGFLVIRLTRRFTLGSDSQQKIQKLHHHRVPRLGGIPVLLGVTAAGLAAAVSASDLITADGFSRFMLTLFPAFVVGLLEDLRGGKVGSWWRLLTTMAAAGFGFVLLGARMSRIDIDWADELLQNSTLVVVALTLVAGAGIPHAINIIDGCNGLASFTAIMALSGLGIAALDVQDYELALLGFSCAGALIGFLIWNFPLGKLFLGDAGAYFSGFMIAELSMLLVARHDGISAWFPMTLVIYPVWETLYSSFRRALESPGRIMQPDARHLHQLIFRRLTRRLLNTTTERGFILANSTSALPFWIWSVIVTTLALQFREDSAALQLICLGFVVVYVPIYAVMARMHIRSRVPHRTTYASTSPLSAGEPVEQQMGQISK